MPEEQGTAYVIDEVKEEVFEIKLGANAAAILAMTKYTDVFEDEQYIPIAQKLASGIYSCKKKMAVLYMC